MTKQRESASRVERLERKGLINPPRWLTSNLCFEGIAGSEAYGCRDPESGDHDIVGFAIAPKHVVFPHLAGHVPGFNTRAQQSFEQFQVHHVLDPEWRVSYDITIYGIVKFFVLTSDNNPNMVDNLYLPLRCITRTGEIYRHVREHRHLFLSKRAYHSFRGFANQEMSKLKKKRARANEQRQASIDAYGYDVKHAYNVVRLMLECEQILSTGDLELDRDAKTYTDIRAGAWTEERLFAWMEAKERALIEVAAKAVVPEKTDLKALERVLKECLEMHFGSLEGAVKERHRDQQILDDIEGVLRRYGR